MSDAAKEERRRRMALAFDAENHLRLRRQVAEAIWHRMAPSHRQSWDEEPDPELYLCAADAAIAKVREVLTYG